MFKVLKSQIFKNKREVSQRMNYKKLTKRLIKIVRKQRKKIRELESQLRIARTSEIIARWQNL